MYEDLTLIVDEKYSKFRVDQFLKLKFPDVSRGTIRKAFLSRSVLINGRQGRKGEILNNGDKVTINRLESKKDLRYTPHLLKGPKVVYTDDSIIAIYKPPFIHTLPGSAGEKDTLANFANYMFPRREDESFSKPPLFLSRLDYETSGIVLMAKNLAAHETLLVMQEKGQILKRYVLIVGREVHEEVVVKNLVITTGGSTVKVDRNRTFDDENYHTRFIPDRVMNGCSMLYGEIRKGRMHQIRAHAAYKGYPILGDRKYGGKTIPPMNSLPLRPLLHSAQIDIPSMDGKDKLRITCSFPEDLFRMVDLLFSS
jgi:23S rRNA-/tRNA-specific pseudouridylate synthase